MIAHILPVYITCRIIYIDVCTSMYVKRGVKERLCGYV